MTAASGSRQAHVTAAVEALHDWIDRRQRTMVGHLHACGQTPAQLHVLGLLTEIGPTTVSHLAAHLGTSAPSTSAVVDRMVDAGLVVRARGEEDRRLVTVSIAAPGQEALQRAVGWRREMLARVLGQLSDGELGDMVRILRRLEEAIGTVAQVAQEAGRPAKA